MLLGLTLLRKAPPPHWAPTTYKWGSNHCKWPYKWVTWGVITLLVGVIPPKTNMEPKNWWFVDVSPFPKGVFSGSMAVFWGVYPYF